MVISFSGMSNVYASTPADVSLVKNQKGCDGKNENFTTLLTFPDSDTFNYNVIHETDISKSMVFWCEDKPFSKITINISDIAGNGSCTTTVYNPNTHGSKDCSNVTFTNGDQYYVLVKTYYQGGNVVTASKTASL